MSKESFSALALVSRCAQPIAPGELRNAQLLEQLTRELHPVGAAETILLAEIARRAAGMENASAAATAWQQFAAESLRDFAVSGIVGAGPNDGPLADVVPCDAADRARRQCLVDSQAFFRALHSLFKLQGRRAVNSRSIAKIPFTGFEREQECVEYLAAWRRRNFNCRACGNHAAHFIASRRCLECSACKAQCGLRSGTLVAVSGLPLSTWFLAIWCVLRQPTIKTRLLQQLLGLRRAATVRAMRDRIHKALVADDRSQLLAGLDQYYAEPESSVLFKIDQQAPMALSLATVRKSQPVHGETFAQTASSEEIQLPT